MKCKNLRLISRYIDNELSANEKDFLTGHILICQDCKRQLQQFSFLKQNIALEKSRENPEFFWQMLKKRITKEEEPQLRAEKFVLDFGIWSKRLIPVPILAIILATIIFNPSQSYYNPIDEYLFNHQDNSVQELVDEPASQPGIGGLLY